MARMTSDGKNERSTVHWCMSVLNADFFYSHGPFWCPNVGLSQWHWCQIVVVQLWAITLGPLCVWFAPPPSGGYEGHLWEGGLRHLIFDIRFPVCTTGICIYPQKRFEPPLPTISIGILFGTSLEQSKIIQNLVETRVGAPNCRDIFYNWIKNLPNLGRKQRCTTNYRETLELNPEFDFFFGNHIRFNNPSVFGLETLGPTNLWKPLLEVPGGVCKCYDNNGCGSNWSSPKNFTVRVPPILWLAWVFLFDIYIYISY